MEVYTANPSKDFFLRVVAKAIKLGVISISKSGHVWLAQSLRCYFGEPCVTQQPRENCIHFGAINSLKSTSVVLTGYVDYYVVVFVQAVKCFRFAGPHHPKGWFAFVCVFFCLREI